MLALEERAGLVQGQVKEKERRADARDPCFFQLFFHLLFKSSFHALSKYYFNTNYFFPFKMISLLLQNKGKQKKPLRIRMMFITFIYCKTHTISSTVKILICLICHNFPSPGMLPRYLSELVFRDIY